MTTSLTVLTKPTVDPSVFDVYWATGRHTQGMVTVSIVTPEEVLPPGLADVAAELSALQHLLERKAVCGSHRTGNSLLLTVSFGAIRKLAVGKSDKAALAPFALFLRTRFSEATISVSKDESFLSYPKAHNHTERLEVSTPLLSGYTFPDGFKVALTGHALERYMVRYQNLVPSNAWRALRAAVESPSTFRQDLSTDERAAYGSSSVAYYSPSFSMRILVVTDALGPKIATVYYAPRPTVRQDFLPA